MYYLLFIVTFLVLTLRLLFNLGVLSLSGPDELAMTSASATPEEEKS